MQDQKAFSVLLLNKPLDGAERDAFHMNVQIEELGNAIDEGANFVGIFSEYGGGKSSVVRSYAKKKKYEICDICLWNYEGNNKCDEDGRMTSFVHSFLYQFSKVVKDSSFTRHINRMLSRNYRQLSFSTDIGVWKRVLLVFFLMFTIGGTVFVTKSEYSAAHQTEENNTLKIQDYVAALYSDKIARSAVCIIFAMLFFSNNSFMVSWKNDGINRELRDADVYEVFEKIVKKAKKRKVKKYILNIEDLDRVTDKGEICEFLKALYRFNNLLTDNDKKKFIFIVSLSLKCYLETQNENLTEKLFDYSVVLRPINRKRIIDLYFNLLKEKRADILCNLRGEEVPGKEWLTKGEYLGIRTIKSRINAALAIHDELSMEKKYKKQQGENDSEEIDFRKCAIVAYLESAYPVDMYYFTDYSSVWENAFQHLENRDGKDADGRLKFYQSLDRYNKISRNFKKEIKALFSGELESKDYWLYFHRNPKKYFGEKNDGRT